MPQSARKTRPEALSGIPGRIKYLLIGTAVGLIAAGIFSLVFSCLMPMSFMPESMLTVLVCLAAFLGAFVSGFVSLRLIGASGLVNGLFSGLIFCAVHLVATVIAGGGFSSPVVWICLALELIGGILGGIVSVNLS